MTKNGIDVSRWQGTIDWSKVKTDFCIIQAGFGREISQKDIQFDANYAGCKAQKIPCGAYWYSYATTVEDAKKEAQTCLQVISGKQYEYPIFYDVEQKQQFQLGKEAVSKIIRAFLETVEAAGYWVGLYMSSSYLNNYVDDDIKKRYSIWVAHYGVSKPDYAGSYAIWQKSPTGSVAGISGNVDLDECYIDFPAEIKAAGLNGFTKPSEEKPKATKNVSLTIDGVTYTGILTEK